MIKGVLFDMDGVLLDTETMGSELMPIEAAKLGYRFTRELYLSILGCTYEKSRQILSEALGKDYPYDAVMKGFYQAFNEAARQGRIPLKKGVEECMNGLKKRGIKRALATSTARDLVDSYIAGIPAMQGAFDVVLCGGEAARSKPAPDIYLEAARRLNVPPDECVGVEDSRNGLLSLRAAGCVCIMIPDLLPYDESLHGIVDLRLNDLTQLCGAIDRLNLNPRTR